MIHHIPTKKTVNTHKRSIMGVKKQGLTPDQVETLRNATRYIYVAAVAREYGIEYAPFYNWMRGAKRPFREHQKYVDFCEQVLGAKL